MSLKGCSRIGAIGLAGLLAAACGDDLAAGADAGAPDAGPPFGGVPERTWTWIPVDGMRCMNGSATGIGVSVDESSDQLMILLEGGGACFNGDTVAP